MAFLSVWLRVQKNKLKKIDSSTFTWNMELKFHKVECLFA